MKSKILLLASLLLLLSGMGLKAQTTIYVNTNATGANNGSSWADAYTNFQTGVNAAISGDAVWVAAGTYQPASGASFSMKEGVKIYGGFNGTETQLSERNWTANITILRGNGSRVVNNDANGLTPAAVLDGFTITGGNINAAHGGGMYNSNASPALSNLIITQNQVTGIAVGGGIYFLNSSSVLTNIIVSKNISTYGGGGIYARKSAIKLINVLISENTGQSGGGLLNYSSTINLFNVTICKNNATSGLGGGIYHDGSTFVGTAQTGIYNCIILGNNSGIATAPGWGSTTGSNNIIQTGGASSDAGIPNTTPGDIFKDYANNDFSLKNGCYAINAGDNSKYPGSINTENDLAGNPRLYQGAIDMGAYEKQKVPITPDISNILFVKKGAAGGGSSWADALGELKDALAWAKLNESSFVGNPLQIWVATGTYQPEASQSFAMVENVKVYGGFAATETQLSERNWTTNVTTLQGNGNTVFNNNGLTSAAILDGFTVTNGNGYNGGGFNNNNASPQLVNLKIIGNVAKQGAGIFNDNASSPAITNAIIDGNTATDWNGGGVFNINNSNPALTNVLISNNTAPWDGAGVYNTNSSSPVLVNVTIVKNNKTNGSGGGMHNGNSSAPVLYNTVILGNNTGVEGNAISGLSANNIIQTGDATSGAGISNTTPGDIFKDFANNDFSLNDGSYAVNGGDNSKYPGDINTEKDIAGSSRLFQKKIDIGAYENQVMNYNPDINGIIYVTTTGAGMKDGSSWTDALDNLQIAINTAGVQQVWVATGTYQPASGTFFSMKEGTKIYGGFAGSETLFSQRNWTTNVTTLQGNGSSVIYNNNNGLTAAAVLDGFTITGGSASDGAGIRNNNASPLFQNLIVSGNAAGNRAGGIYNENNAHASFINVTIKNNTAAHGGGMVNDHSSPILNYVNISGNTATYNGAGMYNIDQASPILTNVLISSNNSTDTYYGGSGAGIFNYDNSSPALINVTISNNTVSAGPGGGIYNQNTGSLPILYNTIILGNNSGISNGTISSASTNNLIQTGDATSGGTADGTGTALSGTTPADIFKNSGGNDFSLKDGSYAVNAGDNSKYPGNINTDKDLAGNPRLYQSKIDIGAYESQFMIIYVTTTGAGSKDGSSWGNALDKVQTAVNTTGVQEVWVAAGTYQPASGTSFSMKEGVKIFGGFAGTETQLSQRNWTTNVTTLQGNGKPVINNNDNGLTNASVLDGFTITGGNAEFPDYGGGISNLNVSPRLSNLIISNNSADWIGGGMYNYNSSPQLSNVSIMNNQSVTYGGGICNEQNSSPLIKDVVLSQNTSGNGGGMFNSISSSPILTNAVIQNNTSVNYGGGLYNYNSSPVLSNVLISSNISQSVGTGGGGMFNTGNSAPTLINVTLVANSANNVVGGGMENTGTSSPLLYNSIILGNSSGAYNNPINSLSSNNLIQVGDFTSGGTADGTGTAITGTTPTDIFKDFAGKDYSHKDGSYVVNAGDNNKYPGDINSDTDIAGNPRLFAGIIDIGAYEFGSQILPVRLAAFNAIRHDKDVLLQWNTATEDKNKGFYIEHSTDGRHWNSLAFVATKASQGNSQLPLAYQYTHANPGAGQRFYRLRQMDIDGKFSYSKVNVVVFDSYVTFTLYPNPVQSKVTIMGLNNGTYKISLVNVDGRLINEYKALSSSAATGSTGATTVNGQFQIDMSRLPGGVYHVIIVDEQGKVESKKVVKK